MHKISLLDDTFDRPAFSSGTESIDSFLHKNVIANSESRLGKTWVLHSEGSNRIIGYFTISMCTIAKEVPPASFFAKNHFPSQDIPAVLLGKLGVDKPYQGQGIGLKLLTCCFKKVLELESAVGCFFLVVDTLDSARGFYTKNGFGPISEQNPNRLVLSVARLKKAYNHFLQQSKGPDLPWQ